MWQNALQIIFEEREKQTQVLESYNKPKVEVQHIRSDSF